MGVPNDSFSGLRRYNLSARFLLEEAEYTVQAGSRRQVCIMAEALLRDLHARGLRPCIVAEGYGATSLIRIERYLADVQSELDPGCGLS